ncbi:hypothetical protein LB507_009805 [Fusarium sp. FIESC RH6]|nr:hypothetical protein LB507_009805 [Fusarium sp. FIESC RH6]
MFQQAPIPDHTYWNTAGIVPKRLSSSIAVGDLVALRRFLSDKLDEPTNPLKEPDTFDLEFPATPFGLTARLNNHAILKKIWRHINPDINGYGMQGFDSCLVEAAQYGNIATLGDILRWGQNNWSSASRGKALSAAAHNWHVENLQLLLSEEIPFEQEALDLALAQVTVPKLCFERRDQTQAEIIAQSQSIKVLMAAGANPSKPGPRGIEPILIWTALCRKLYYCLKALLDNGADPNITNSQGQTALHYLGARVKRDPVSRRRREDNEPIEAVFHTLLAHNASVRQQDLLGNTPLHFAAYGSPIKVLRQLLSSIPVESQKDALKMPNHNGETALHFVAAGGRIDTIKYLLSDNVGLDINETAFMGWTPLLRALAPTEPSLAGLSSSRKVEAAQLLLARGADPSRTAHDGWTPLHCLTMNPTYGKSDEVPRLVETLLLGGNSVDSRASFAVDNPPNRPTRKHRVQDEIY